MILFPAIDIKDGQCVRLKQGDFKQKTVYGENPLAVAKSWQEQGSKVLHVVDLDGARDGQSDNGEIIADMIAQTGLFVQVGGGIRNLERIKYWIEKGVQRVIIGTAAITNPSLIDQAIALYGEKICVSVDAKDGKVATHGWEQTSDVDGIIFCQQLEEKGVSTVVYTDISKDGMLSGPNMSAYKTLLEKTNLQIIASGGVSSLEDVKELHRLGVYGAISGVALYEGKFTLEEALLCLQEG